jgi:hypothetical protein
MALYGQLRSGSNFAPKPGFANGATTGATGVSNPADIPGTGAGVDQSPGAVGWPQKEAAGIGITGGSGGHLPLAQTTLAAPLGQPIVCLDPQWQFWSVDGQNATQNGGAYTG